VARPSTSLLEEELQRAQTAALEQSVVDLEAIMARLSELEGRLERAEPRIVSGRQEATLKRWREALAGAWAAVTQLLQVVEEQRRAFA